MHTHCCQGRMLEMQERIWRRVEEVMVRRKVVWDLIFIIHLHPH